MMFASRTLYRAVTHSVVRRTSMFEELNIRAIGHSAGERATQLNPSLWPEIALDENALSVELELQLRNEHQRIKRLVKKSRMSPSRSQGLFEMELFVASRAVDTIRSQIVLSEYLCFIYLVYFL